MKRNEMVALKEWPKSLITVIAASSCPLSSSLSFLFLFLFRNANSDKSRSFCMQIHFYVSFAPSNSRDSTSALYHHYNAAKNQSSVLLLDNI